jgi:phosphoglycolate phosphatase-like HAD superfamily hydrolase
MARQNAHSRISHCCELLRNVHIRRRSLECATMLEDLASDTAWAPFVDRPEILARTANAYRRHWDAHLAPYDGIRDSLARLSEKGWQIVAYTESDATVTATRLARMGFTGVVTQVFGRAPFAHPTRREWALVDVPATSAHRHRPHSALRHEAESVWPSQHRGSL